DLIMGYIDPVSGDLHYTLEDIPDTEFQQGANFVDIDVDGDLDHFACDDIALSVPSRNDGTGNFTEDYSLINPVSTVPSDNSGNYASIWTDFDDDGDVDLYLSKCRQGVTDPDDGRRLNQLFRNDGNGNFVDIAEAVGLLPRAQTWSTDFADVDNDGDLDAFILNHEAPSLMMINDGQGLFHDSSTVWGIPAEHFALGIQCNFEDFDNDGWIDLLVTFTGGFTELYLNNEGEGFTLLTAGDFTAEIAQQTLQSAATGDLNNDGYIDIYGANAFGFNGPSSVPDALLINNGGSNNHLKVNLSGTMSNRNGIGAKIKIYGSWGVQTREVRSGEGYGISNALTAHFGLGAATEVDRLVIQWPSGLIEETFNVAANTTPTYTEGSLIATLPLEWKSLTATPLASKRVQLDWQTEQEDGTSHFVVERRVGSSWVEVAQTPALGQRGTNQYQAFDETATPGENVYRVQQIDLSGASSYSPLATAMLQGTGLSIFPNPATNYLQVKHGHESAEEIILETIAGQVLRRTTNPELQLTDLPAGVYLVRVKDEVTKLVVR
ncbi:MAG: FG-GAP-like repeat-containing protein, partial [Bacteroidota bacterium]